MHNKNKFKYIFLGFVILICFLVGLLFVYWNTDSGTSEQEKENQQRISNAAKFLSFQTIDKKYYAATESKKVKIISFWAPWCEPCVRELPELNRKLSENQSIEIDWILISVDTNIVEVNQIFSKFPNIQEKALLVNDTAGIFKNQFGIQKIPETFFMTKDNLIHLRIPGEIKWNSSSLDVVLRKLLEL